jgi:Na+-driven multidrug efflux pump
MAVGLVPFSVYLYALRGFYALTDTFTPFWINVIENGLNIALALVLFPSLGVQGLAWAWTGAYSVAAVIALVVLSRRVPAPARRPRTAPCWQPPSHPSWPAAATRSRWSRCARPSSARWSRYSAAAPPPRSSWTRSLEAGNV